MNLFKVINGNAHQINLSPLGTNFIFNRITLSSFTAVNQVIDMLDVHGFDQGGTHPRLSKDALSDQWQIFDAPHDGYRMMNNPTATYAVSYANMASIIIDYADPIIWRNLNG